MSHDWVFDVLDDLHSYAVANDLPALAAKIEELVQIAAAEIAAKSGDQGGTPPSGWPH